ncbi:DgyrCDS9299 [Dimorphilus gyrociliatus]|uniref:DgyrCDS9299 n=1 Tax=Dimorphilus gyrociliatus TaxID=2664684 RepID=A0A7I8VWY3_9ANNE|nr:DgyrCDS9299 [Dimorphilus gyrociliatus]
MVDRQDSNQILKPPTPPTTMEEDRDYENCGLLIENYSTDEKLGMMTENRKLCQLKEESRNQPIQSAPQNCVAIKQQPKQSELVVGPPPMYFLQENRTTAANLRQQRLRLERIRAARMSIKDLRESVMNTKEKVILFLSVVIITFTVVLVTFVLSTPI